MVIPILHTSRLTLRPFAPDDAATVQRLAGVPEVALTTKNIPYPYEDGLAESWIATHQDKWEAKESLTLAITVDVHGLVGAVGLVLNMSHRRGELGYWIARDHWNQGYATEAAVALINYGFDELELNRIQARYFTRNPASGRVMEKAGMKYEGLFRQHALVRGVFEDVAVYAILSSEL